MNISAFFVVTYCGMLWNVPPFPITSSNVQMSSTVAFPVDLRAFGASLAIRNVSQYIYIYIYIYIM